jgi:hypothetical protein
MVVNIKVSTKTMKGTKVSLYITLHSNFTSANLKRRVDLKNGVESRNSSVQILIAQDAVLSPWSDWSDCSISCTDQSKLDGNFCYIDFLKRSQTQNHVQTALRGKITKHGAQGDIFKWTNFAKK